MRYPRRLMWIGIGLAAVMTSGCGSSRHAVQPVATPPPTERPADLAVAVTVFSPRKPLPPSTLPRSLKPGRYILEADGVLRASRAAVPDAAGFPPRARQLSPRQQDQVWRVIRDSGLLEGDNPNQINDPESAARSGDHTTALIYVAFQGRRSTLRILLDRSGADAVAAERIIDRLAELSWIRDDF